MIFRITITAALILTMTSCTGRKEISQWRGPDRNGKYPEAGLLNVWPEEGPALLWSFEGLGKGHGSVGIGDDQLFILGMPDTMGILYSFDLQGKLLWQKEYGPEWYANYTGPRSTPTIIDGLLYFVSGRGVAFCMETKTGDIRWSVDMFEQFGAQKTKWGIAESPLIDGDKIIITPGGSEHNVVALDRFSGEPIWTARGNGEPSAYCSPILAVHNETRLIVTMTSESVIGIDADNGKTLWRIEQRQGNEIHANNPVYYEGKIYCASAKDDTLTGHLMIELSEDGKTAAAGWRQQNRYNLMGGIILHGDGLFSSTNKKKEFYCIDAETGSLNYLSDQATGGVLIYADGLFYLYGTDGIMALVEADEKDCRVISRFKIELGTEQHWSHPVIRDGKLYVHHGNALICYDITE